MLFNAASSPPTGMILPVIFHVSSTTGFDDLLEKQKAADLAAFLFYSVARLSFLIFIPGHLETLILDEHYVTMVKQIFFRWIVCTLGINVPEFPFISRAPLLMLKL